MLFNSYIFIFLFFPVTLLGYFLFGKLKNLQIRNIFLIAMSLWFYGYFNPSYLWIICGSIVFNFAASKLIQRAGTKRSAKLITAVAVIVNIAIIFYYKYYDFFISNVNSALGASFELKHIVLPLGISFFTFQQLSYIIDSYHGETDGYRFDEYALFVCYFPQLIAGPIVLHDEIIPQFRDDSSRRFNPDNFARGMYIFALGLFKKVIVADTFSAAVTWGFADIAGLGSLEAWIVSISYTFQLYFDFSGYCDMAIGIGAMMNIDITQNFNSPYKALSISEFWSRWHITLTRFLRSYIYFPLGGSRKGAIRTYFNIMVVFLVSGIWHGANWTFIVWGLLHGVLQCITRLFNKQYEKLHTVTKWMLTMFSINILLVIFRADSLSSATDFIMHMFLSPDLSISNELARCFQLVEFNQLRYLIPTGLQYYLTNYEMWIFLTLALFGVLNFKNSKELTFKPNCGRGILTVVFMFWSIISLSGVSEFLYFNF